MNTRMLTLVVSLLAVLISHTTKAQNLEKIISQKDTTFQTTDGTRVIAEVGIVQVPENRNSESSRFIHVNYVRLKSISTSPKAPLIYLAGGPGNTCTWQAEDPDYLTDWLPYLAVSDVILYDQRGTKDPNLVSYWLTGYPEGFLVTEEAAGKHWQAMSKQALASFKENDIDILGYTTLENARDIEALRQVLKLEKYAILGFSYGTHLGLTLLKLYPNKIENAVLAGVEGLNQTFDYPSLLDTHFKKIAHLSDADPEIAKYVPDFYALLQKVMHKLKETPMEMEISDPITQQPMKVKVGAFGLAMILRVDAGDASDIPLFPRLLYTIDQGDDSLLKWFVQKRIVYAYGVPGMSIMMDLASGASNNRWQQIEKETRTSLFMNIANFPFYQVKELWPKTTMELDFTLPITSKVRTLFLSGEYDYNTPPFQAEEIKWGFANATHLIVANAGHEQILSNSTIKTAIIDFLKGQEVSDRKAVDDKLKFIPIMGNHFSHRHPALR